MRVVGVDLSLDTARTSVAVIACAPGIVGVERTATGVDDDHLRRLIADTTIEAFGFDAPVRAGGSAAVRTLTGSQRQADDGAAASSSAEPLASTVARRLTTVQAIRATDRWRRERLAALPLPTGAASSWRSSAGLRVDRLLADQDQRSKDPTRFAQRFVEADPAIALYQWSLPYSGYLAHEGRAELAEVRETVVAALAERLSVPVQSLQVRDGGQLNALLAALVAAATRLGLCERVPDSEQVHARVEGWTQIPTAESLDELPRRTPAAA